MSTQYISLVLDRLAAILGLVPLQVPFSKLPHTQVVFQHASERDCKRSVVILDSLRVSRISERLLTSSTPLTLTGLRARPYTTRLPDQYTAPLFASGYRTNSHFEILTAYTAQPQPRGKCTIVIRYITKLLLNRLPWKNLAFPHVP